MRRGGKVMRLGTPGIGHPPCRHEKVSVLQTLDGRLFERCRECGAVVRFLVVAKKKKRRER